MSTYLLNEWKKRPGGPQDPTAFMRTLDSDRASLKEKEVIVKAFDDWDVLTPTWFEVADYLPAIERLHENNDFPERLRAALLASKVAYCLGDYKGALMLALSAEDLFSLTPRDGSAAVGQQDEQYVNRMIEEALDTYKTAKRNGAAIDTRLEALINRLFERNLNKKDLRYVIGLAIDTRRVDMIETAVKAADDQAAILIETVASVLEGQIDTGLRHQILTLLLRMFCNLDQPDFVNVCQCLIKLEKPTDVADIIDKLIGQDMKTDGALLAYQIAFDLYENATQQFVKKILAAMAKIDNELPGSSSASPVPPSTPPLNPSPTSDSPSPVNTGLTPVPAPEQLEPLARPTTPSPENPKTIIFRRIRGILRGEETIRHHMQFLIKNNHTDMLVLKEMKDCVRTAMAHNATLLANGLMHLGTTCDDFLRENLEWISKATNWNKFNAVATLGMIHRGHEAAALKLLDPYLPKAEADQFGFKEGGSLYAYGMIHAHHGNALVTKYLRDQLSTAQTAAVRHGACLGLGLATMASHDDEVYAHLRETLNMDDAVTGEAAGTAMGLTMVGSLNNTAFEEMVQYMNETSHDKIQRGLRTGIALLGYGRQEEAEVWIGRLLEAKSCAVMRQAGVCLMAMAYAGTGNASVVKRLLAKVASDPNNDVKRMAVIAIGFLLSK
ncbi:rpn-2 [Pristionchus pacificus]|uniref:Rpn-2 n=1 Tax=Pristionchus pacificus TaxID=54126 RepID=A0A454XI76_PRIPA|nr:rpn-2 [Pristionchus pacificus]|eukprot:PDM83533.1 rpn-2 [Pristionchus pacificus]